MRLLLQIAIRLLLQIALVRASRIIMVCCGGTAIVPVVEHEESDKIEPKKAGGMRIDSYKSVYEHSNDGCTLNLRLARMLCELSDIVYLTPEGAEYGQWASRAPLPEAPNPLTMKDLPVHLRMKLGYLSEQMGRNYHWKLQPLPTSFNVDSHDGKLVMHDGILVDKRTDTEALILLSEGHDDDEEGGEFSGKEGGVRTEPAVFLIMRGTASLADVITDLMIFKRKDTTMNAGGKVHKGFLNAYSSSNSNSAVA